MQQASETTRILVGRSRSNATNQAYAMQWRNYVAWCDSAGHDPFPASVEVVATYLASFVGLGMRSSSVRQSLAAIRAAHSDNDFLPGAAQALASLSSSRMNAVISGLQRSIGEQGGNRVRKPRALVQSEITAMSTTCPTTHQGVQDRAMLLLGCNSGMRSSELVTLTVGDIRFDAQGMDVFIAHSKTDQTRVGETVFVGRLAPHLAALDPVRAMEEHITHNRSEASMSAPLFMAWRKGGNTPHLVSGSEHSLTRAAVSDCVQRCSTRAGIAVDSQRHLSSHSLRHTFITQAFSQGIPATEIARTSRHKSLTVLEGYNQSSRRTTVVSPRLWN
ncbi:tyrosine-type recombinase/integrase [Kocuria sp.]|uniref:tyrosine-type recombinase/integrase n=1 Tax=Kocuria sp. TaxID=1871328 RepID=UPI0028ADF004|nr:tyrosine-type recombinase/integrase [Kocuria sp.]